RDDVLSFGVVGLSARVLLARKRNASAIRTGFRLWALGFSKSPLRAAQSLKSKAQSLVLLILARSICLQTIAFRDLRFELVVGHVVVGEPVARHVVGGAIAEADPVARVWIVPVP